MTSIQLPPRSAPTGMGRRVGLGDFQPSLAADAARYGIKTERLEYVIGLAGVKLSLEQIGRRIREGSISPSMQQFAEGIIRNWAKVGVQEKLSNTQVAQIFLDYVRANIRYRPDPNNVEYVKSAHVTLCVPGAAMCIPIEDCDGLIVALGSLMGSYGIPVRVMKQTFAGGEQEHVLIIFETDDGKWMAADPSAPPSKPVGWRMPADKEVTVDPSDPKTLGLTGDGAEFVGVGGLPDGGRVRMRRLGAVPVWQIVSDRTILPGQTYKIDFVVSAFPDTTDPRPGDYGAAADKNAYLMKMLADNWAVSSLTQTSTVSGGVDSWEMIATSKVTVPSTLNDDTFFSLGLLSIQVPSSGATAGGSTSSNETAPPDANGAGFTFGTILLLGAAGTALYFAAKHYGPPAVSSLRQRVAKRIAG